MIVGRSPKRLLLALAALAGSLAFAAAKVPSGEPTRPQGPNPFLAQAKENFQNLEFEQCLKRLAQAPQWRSSPRELLEIELYAGMCSFSINQLPAADERFRLALRIQPTAELPTYTSPKLLEFFHRIKKSMPPPEKVEKPPPEKVEKPPPEKVEKPPEKRVEKPPEKKVEKVEKPPEKAAEPEKKPDPEKVASNETVEAPPEENPPPEKKPEVSDRPVRDEPPPKLVPENPNTGLPSTPDPFIKRHAGPIAVGGVAVVAAAVGFGLGANAKSLEARANQAQYDSDFHKLGSQAKGEATGANIAFAIAGAAAVAAIIWALVDAM